MNASTLKPIQMQHNLKVGSGLLILTFLHARVAAQTTQKRSLGRKR
jgi:hypothetical protein